MSATPETADKYKYEYTPDAVYLIAKIPPPVLWANHDIMTDGEHGMPHSFEMLMWLYNLWPELEKRLGEQINKVNFDSLEFSCSHHDIGRTTNEHDPNHANRAVTQLGSACGRRAKYLIRYHVNKVTSDTPLDLRILHFLDVLTMTGRYPDEDWHENGDRVGTLRKNCPIGPDGQPVFSDKELQQLIDTEKQLRNFSDHSDPSDPLNNIVCNARRLGLVR